jgi:hypothetical protein
VAAETTDVDILGARTMPFLSFVGGNHQEDDVFGAVIVGPA